MGRSFRRTVSTAAVVALVATARRARSREVTATEERVFRAFNRAPESIRAPVWAVMQSGSLGAVFVVAGDLRRRGRSRASAVVATVGTAVWVGAKVVKPLIGRGRPADHLDGVLIRGKAPTGLGYPSGHAAVALTLALVATSRSRAPVRVAAVTTALLSGGARMYVGAHLPLDVVGGFAIGTLCGRLAAEIEELPGAGRQ
jgi:membrane-associated phospholipid phosphatase